MTTGQRMKARRKEIGLSAETVAERLGVSPATIYRYENGGIDKVPGDRLGPIADILQTTPAYLMGWENETGAVDLGLAAIDIAKKHGYNAVDILDVIKSMKHILPIDEDAIVMEVEKRKPTPVSESGQPINIVKIAGRDGRYMEKRLTDEQIKALQTIIDQMPEADDL